MTEKRSRFLPVLLLFCVFCVIPAIADTSTEYWAPWVTKTTTTSAVINWWHESPGSGWTVQYANASYYDVHGKFDHSVPDPDPDPANFHHVLLTGLTPDTTYRYQVQAAGSNPPGNSQVFSVRKFQTFPVSGPFTFVVISDTHAQEERFRYVADALANESGVLFILDGGDYASHDIESQWAYYYGYGDRMLANLSLYTSIGNHEYHNGTAENVSTDAYYYRNSFVNPLYYSFDCAGIRFVILDSPDPTNPNDENPTRAHSEAQAPWLKDQLDNTLYGTFVIHHHPVWTVGHADADPALQSWETLFHTYNISAHFDGHIHTYQRFSVEGIPYFVVANAGGGFVSLTDKPVPPSYVTGATKELGYLKVTVDQANNTATANEYFVASLPDYNSITGTVISPPRLADTITFPLKTKTPDPGGIPITAPAVISTPGHYRLTNDLSNSTADTAIRITASDVLLEGNGHVLDGNGSSNSTGVLISGGSAGTGNVTVRGLTVSGWQMGIDVDNQIGGEINGCNATRNELGIYLDSSEKILLKEVNASGNIPKNGGGGNGITLYDSPSCTISGSTISRNGHGAPLYVGGYGILLDSSPGTEISGCTLNGNLNTAIEDDYAPKDLLLTRNVMSENGGNGGIFLGTLKSSRTQNCTISENHFSRNPAGITIDQADNCVMNQNDLTGGGVGISIVSSRNATLTGNTMTGNQYNLQVYGTEEQYYQHMIGTSNTVNGKLVYYLFQKPGTVIDATNRAGTVYGIDSPGIIIRDVTLTNSTTGVLLFNSDSAQVQNVTTGGNQVGISISGCTDLAVSNSTSSGNSLTGFDIQNSANVTLRGVTANENINPQPGTGSGISVDTSSNIYIINATTDRNAFAGIEISGGNKALLSQVTASRNGIAGLVLGGDGTQVTGCRIKDNGEAGIGLIQADDSMIVNNWFSNTVNVYIGDGVTGTTWNTTKTTGTNIVNGPFLGGNYWAKPDGTGWSQVTPDRGDGFCNAPFVIDANNTDYLPLHSYTPKPTFQADFTVSPVTGTAPLTVKCTDKSIGNPTRFMYDFGDGVSVTGPNPVHTYRFPGNYSVTLTITKYNSATNTIIGTSTTKTNVITVSKVPFITPVAKFTASPVNGTAPLTVTFTDQSTGSPTYLNYDFGDGINMTGPNPVHTYRHPGVYNVTLLVLKYDASNGSIMSDSDVQTGLIIVNGI